MVHIIRPPQFVGFSRQDCLLKRCPIKAPPGSTCAASQIAAAKNVARSFAHDSGCHALGTLVLVLSLLFSAKMATAQIRLPEPNTAAPISISAESANRWQKGGYEVWILRGNCRIAQGGDLATGDEAVLWIDHADAVGRRRSNIIAYLEGRVTRNFNNPGEDSRNPAEGNSRPSARMTDRSWFGRLYTDSSVRINVVRSAGEPQVKPAIFERASALREPNAASSSQVGQIQAAQFTELLEDSTNPQLVPEAETLVNGGRRVRVFPRSNAPVQAQWFPDPTGTHWIAVIDSGVNVIVDGLDEVGSIDVATDRLVIWTTGTGEPDLTGQTRQDYRVPLEFYMEGNIVFRQGERVIHAKRMYYDVANRVGTVLDAELLTPVPEYAGLLRLHAKVIEQMGENRFFARDAFLTSSRMGWPGYRAQAGGIYFEDIQTPMVDRFSRQPVIDPVTGQQAMHHRRMATASNNFLFLGDVPIFYWPFMATDLTDPTFYIRGAQIKNDSVFGTQILTTWDGFQLLGMRNPPDGMDWDISLDYLSKRGCGHGTTLLYDRDSFFMLPGPTSGLADFWGIKDKGTDNLGRGRRNLEPEEDYRFRLFWKHRQMIQGEYQLSAELGWISDRNFLEQYYEREWDELKDQTTGVEFKRIRDNGSWSVIGYGRLNDFFTQTEWLPRADHFKLGQQFFNSTFTWYEHSQVAYARQRVATAPEDPSEAAIFHLLPWESGSSGERLVTRQEIDYPVQLGAVKVVPYLLGELAHWGENLAGEDTQRAYGQVGFRASMPMWKIDPTIHSDLLNVHGLAHKVIFEAEFAAADSNRDMYSLPLYDPLDDDSIEAFQRRFAPAMVSQGPFDPRSYALRSGMASWVTAPSTEVADDLMFLRLGARQRWQTKRGMPGNRRIMDWIVFDTNVTVFPKPNRDNFGKSVGLLDYSARWHIGDRTTLVSDGMFDFFDQGQCIVNVGGFLNRPPRGNVYVGLRILEGPVSSHVLSMSYNYHMSPKWISSFGMSVDVGGSGNIGQNFKITRIGESLLVSAGFNVNASRGDVGVSLAVEPRFLPKTRLGSTGGVRIPVAGARGLE